MAGCHQTRCSPSCSSKATARPSHCWSRSQVTASRLARRSRSTASRLARISTAHAVIRGWHSKENRYADAGATVGAAGLASRVRVKPANLQKVVEERDAAAAKQGSKDAKGKHYGPLNIKPGRVVRMHGLQSRADLNDRHAVVEKWDHAAGRYHLWVRPAVGHRAEVVRVKPENASKDICDDTVDPDELPPRGVVTAPSAATTARSPRALSRRCRWAP
jgi:hypothetical protein